MTDSTYLVISFGHSMPSAYKALDSVPLLFVGELVSTRGTKSELAAVWTGSCIK